MIKTRVFIILLFVYIVSDVIGSVIENNFRSKHNVRNKKLLFYDEEGNLVKTFTNPYLRDFVQNPETYPFFGNFFRPFQSLLQPSSTGNAVSYMIPVSNDVGQQINQDPMYQNKIIFMPSKDTSIELNSLCYGKRTQIPSPNSCSSFLNCWDGWAFEQECPAGLLFSKEGFCDYFHRVNCDNRRLNDDTGASQQSCDKELEAFRNQAQCSEFFVCVNRLPVKFKCPADLHFSERLGVCDYPYRVNCNASLSINPATTGMPSSSSSEAPVTESASSSSPTKKLMLFQDAVYDDSGLVKIAMSRHDAIRQMQLSRISRVNMA